MRRFGRYELIEKIATGGMAEIFLARHHALPDFDRLVVVKRLLPALARDATFVSMFLDEARTSAGLNHPNVVQIYDLGVMDDQYFIAMELIEGEDLVEITHRATELEQSIPVAIAARIVADTCKALHHAHEQTGYDGKPLNIVHRDVSPHNVLVTYAGDVKIVDFGIAKARTQTSKTGAGMLKGKYSYMSPEQCMGTSLDRRSDLFSLGVVLYELTTGRRLFHFERSHDILEAITEAPIPPPSQVVRGYPKALEAIVLRALERDPDRRYATALDLQRALEEFLRGSATSSVEVGAWVKELFGAIMVEKRRVIDALVSGRDRPDFEGAFPVASTLPGLDTDVFRRRTREGLAVGPTVIGRRGATEWRYQPLPARRRVAFSRMSVTTRAAILCTAVAAFMCAALLSTLV
ncbi:MAG: serine/threonine-protein kinase [Deltaproteobacteria bacterium]